MKWIVGIETAGAHEGPIRFSRWLAGTCFAARGGRLRPVHVLPHRGLLAEVASPEEIDRVWKTARAELAKTLGPSQGDAALLMEPSIVDADTIEAGLTEAAQEEGAEALVVGRRAPMGDRAFVRLGPVARRLLRSLPVPIIVAPPAPQPTSANEGPIVVGIDLERHSEGAALFARDLARLLDRTLVLVFVVPTVSFASTYLALPALDRLDEAAHQSHAAKLREWAHHHGLEQAALVVLRGEPVEQLATAAAAHGACLVVTGSRRLSTVERLFSTSFSSELAASAECPVAVVPG